MKVEIDDDTELAYVLNKLSEDAQLQSGGEADVEDVAEQLLREAAAQQYQQMVIGGR